MYIHIQYIYIFFFFFNLMSSGLYTTLLNIFRSLGGKLNKVKFYRNLLLYKDILALKQI